MKILVLESSPHKNGSSNMLAEQFIKGAKEAGHEITVRDVGHMQINPCRACDACGLSNGCVQKDDMKQIEKDLLSTDMAVFVTPIYYYQMSAQRKRSYSKACRESFKSHRRRSSRDKAADAIH